MEEESFSGVISNICSATDTDEGSLTSGHFGGLLLFNATNVKPLVTFVACYPFNVVWVKGEAAWRFRLLANVAGF